MRHNHLEGFKSLSGVSEAAESVSEDQLPGKMLNESGTPDALDMLVNDLEENPEPEDHES